MKKDEGRYTLRFNPKYPRQKRTMDFLDSAGRHKASYLADIVCEYLDRQHLGSGHAAPIISANQALMFEPTSESVYKNKEIASAAASALKSSELLLLNGTGADSSEDAPISDDVRQAILGGLNIFNGQA